MSQVSETPTNPDLESTHSVVISPRVVAPEESTASPSDVENQPEQTISRKKSVLASAFGSLRSRFRGNAHHDPDVQVTAPREPRTPQKPWKKYATMRGTRSEHKQENDKPQDPGTSEQNPKPPKKAKRRKSLGDFWGSMSGKRSQKPADDGLPTMIVTVPTVPIKNAEMIDPPTQTLSGASLVRVHAHDSDSFNASVGQKPVEPMSLDPQSLPTVKLPDPMLKTDETHDDFQAKHRLASRSSSLFSRALHSILPKGKLNILPTEDCANVKIADPHSTAKPCQRSDSAIEIRPGDFEEFSLADCRGVQQDSPEKVSYCTPGDFQESFEITSTTTSRIRCEFSNWDDEVTNRLDSLFKQTYNQDAIESSSDAHLHQAGVRTDDEFTRLTCDKSKEVVPQTSAVASTRPLEPCKAESALVEGLEDPFGTNPYLELTAQVHRVSSDVPFSTISLLERAVKTVNFDSIFCHKDTMAHRHEGPFTGTSQQTEMSKEFIERQIALTAAQMSKNYRLSRRVIRMIEGILGTSRSFTDTSAEDVTRSSRSYTDISSQDETCIGNSPEVDLEKEEASSCCILMNLDPFALFDKEPTEESCRAMTEKEDQKHHSAIRKLAEDNWIPEVNNIESFLANGLGTFELINSFPDYAPQKSVAGWTEPVLENTIELRSAVQETLDLVEDPASTNSVSPVSRSGTNWAIFTNGASIKQNESFGPGPIKVSFPCTEEHGPFTRSYRSRQEAIQGIFDLCTREGFSDYCAYDPTANVLHMRLADETSVLDIMSELDKGQEIVWLPMALKKKENAEFEDFVFNQQDSEDTVDIEMESSRSNSLHENASLANIESFPEYDGAALSDSFSDYHGASPAETIHDSPTSTPTKDATGEIPVETFGGSPHGLVEPFPQYQDDLAETISERNNAYDQSTITVREIAPSDSDYCDSEVDPDLARRYLGSDFCDSYLDGEGSTDSRGEEPTATTTTLESKSKSVGAGASDSPGTRIPLPVSPSTTASSLASGSNTISVPMPKSISPLLSGFNFSKYRDLISNASRDVSQTSHKEHGETKGDSKGKSKIVLESEIKASEETPLESELKSQPTSPITPRRSTAKNNECSVCGAFESRVRCKRAWATKCRDCGKRVTQQACPKCGYWVVMHTCAMCGKKPVPCKSCERNPDPCSTCGFEPLPPLPGTPKPSGIPRSPSKTKGSLATIAGSSADVSMRPVSIGLGHVDGISEDRYVPGQYPDDRKFGDFCEAESQSSSDSTVPEDLY